MNNNENLYNTMISTAASCIRSSIEDHLPDSTQKSFMLWILSDGNPYQEKYLRMMGVAGSIELEIFLFQKIINLQTLKKLTESIGLLNAYFAFETLSDNIAIGLGESTKDNNPTYQIQKELIIGFNNAIIAKLKNNNQSVFELLKPYEHLTKKISAYQKCLLPSQMYEFAAEYQKLNPNVLLSDLEYCYFPILILNIHTCLELVKSLQNHPLHLILRDSLIDRYTAVNEIIQSDHTISLETLSDLGAKSMLVMPSLAFCIGSLDNNEPNEFLHKTIENGSLKDNLYNASLIVRLLNDMGTSLLDVKPKQLKQIISELNQMQQRQANIPIFEFLVQIANNEQFYKLMLRIRKDIQFGEFNICLDHLSKKNTVDALKEFFKRIEYFTKLYNKHKKFSKSLSSLFNKNLIDKKINEIVINFVKFHQQMYSKEFETKYGDYAITREKREDS